MQHLALATAVLCLLLSACRGFQRQDSRETGYANALECIEVLADTAARSAELCGRRGFDPSVEQYREGYEAALQCARSRGESPAVEAATACRQGA